MCFIEKTEKILVTGAADFLGGSVATQLIKQGVSEQLCFLIDAISPGQGLKILRYNLRAHGVGEYSLAELKLHQCNKCILVDLLQTNCSHCVIDRFWPKAAHQKNHIAHHQACRLRF